MYDRGWDGSLLRRYGRDVEVVRALAKVFNFTIKFVEPPQGTSCVPRYFSYLRSCLVCTGEAQTSLVLYRNLKDKIRDSARPVHFLVWKRLLLNDY